MSSAGIQFDIKKVTGVVVLYNPPESVYNNIQSYIDQLAVLYVVDNSTVINKALVEKLSTNAKVVYLNAGGNKGMGYALNVGASNSLNNNFSILLTMDQDTKLFPGYVEALGTHMNSDVGIVAPWYKGSVKKENEVEEIAFAMTSGNLLNMEAWKKAGGFRDDFFIDHIDHEYGLRLNAAGFKVLQVNTVELDHKPGLTQIWRFLGLRFSYVIHSPERNYYFTRNGFYVSKAHRNTKWNFRSFFNRLLLKNILKAMVHKENRGRRLRLIWRGYKDYRKNATGVLNEAR